MDSKRKSISVLIADDHPIYRDGIKTILNDIDFIDHCAEAVDGRHTLRMLGERHYDIVFLDIDMPIMDGIEAAKEIIKNHRNTRIVILTSSNNKRQIVDLLSLGVSGYVLKNTDSKELLSSIERVLEGNLYLTPEVYTIYARYLVNQSVQKPGVEYDIDLTKREVEVLRLICKQMTAKQIGAKLFISDATVNNHKASIAKKIGTDNVVGMVIYAVKMGYYTP